MRKTVYWMEGDGIGPEIWRATRPVLDAAVRRAYGDGRGLDWVELAAGEKAMTATGNPLPQETLDALSKADVAIKGPLGTPVGGAAPDFRFIRLHPARALVRRSLCPGQAS